MSSASSAELEHYLQFFEHFHDEIGELIAGLPPEALDWRPLVSDSESTNSLAVLLTHLTGAQQFWVGEMAGQRPANRVRDEEFLVAGMDEARLRQRLDATQQLVREVLSTLPAARLDESVERTDEDGTETFTVRWSVVHALGHTAVHVGQMQLTRQLWQASQAAQQS